jgi:hypothetical protein
MISASAGRTRPTAAKKVGTSGVTVIFGVDRRLGRIPHRAFAVLALGVD